MPKVKLDVSKLPPEWRGFGERLRHAVTVRMRQWQCSQNEIEEAAGMARGGLTKAMARGNVYGHTVAQLVLLLKLQSDWLLLGRGPSGLESVTKFIEVPLGNGSVDAEPMPKKLPKSPPASERKRAPDKRRRSVHNANYR